MLACGALGGANVGLRYAQVDSLHTTDNLYYESSVDLVSRYKILKHGGSVHLFYQRVKGEYKPESSTYEANSYTPMCRFTSESIRMLLSIK